MSPLIEYLINHLGWKGAMLVISCLMLKCCLFGLLFRPVPSVVDTAPEYSSVDDVEGKEMELNLTVISSTADVEPDELTDQENVSGMSQSAPRLSMPHEPDLSPSSRSVNCKSAKSMCSVQLYLNDEPMDDAKQRSQSFSRGFLYRKDTFYSGSLMNITPNCKAADEKSYQQKKASHKSPGCCFRWLSQFISNEMMDNLTEMIDLSLLRNSIFLIFSISNFLTSVGYHIPFIYLKVINF